MNDPHWERMIRERLHFLYPSEQVSKVIGKSTIVGVAVIGLFFIGSILLIKEDKSVLGSEEKVPGEILPLYFFSYDIASTTENCPQTESIDWDIAIIAMSDYWQYGAGSTSSASNQEPAEIQRSFSLNCERNMAIYNEMVERNPDLLKRENKTEYP